MGECALGFSNLTAGTGSPCRQLLSRHPASKILSGPAQPRGLGPRPPRPGLQWERPPARAGRRLGPEPRHFSGASRLRAREPLPTKAKPEGGASPRGEAKKKPPVLCGRPGTRRRRVQEGIGWKVSSTSKIPVRLPSPYPANGGFAPPSKGGGWAARCVGRAPERLMG
jgi:hypothetical protein